MKQANNSRQGTSDILEGLKMFNCWFLPGVILPIIMIILVANLKSVIPFVNMSASLFEPSQTISMSSTKSRWLMASPFEILIPEKRPPTFASIKKWLMLYATSRKSRGDSGKPCQIPLSAWKKFVAEPLSKMEKETEFKHAIIQLTKYSLKARCIRSILMYNHITLSKALNRSSFC